MKIKHLAVLALLLPSLAQAEAIATLPNQGGGKIVITNQVCKHDGKTYEALGRAYSYTEQGTTMEGCYLIEDMTVVIVWKIGDAAEKKRYPIENFTAVKQKQSAPLRNLI